MPTTSIAVIGAGFSGTLLAWHLMERCPPSTRIQLIERQNRVGRGVAYGTENPNHLLNVPAGRMSAFEDRPDDFLDWLAAASEVAGPTPAASSFVPRYLYGRYVEDRLDQARQGDRLTVRHGDVVSLAHNGASWTLAFASGERLRVDLVVLAIGNFPPQPLPLADPAVFAAGTYRADPWMPDALDGLAAEAPVLLLGTGLTMIDMVIGLLDRGHAGPIHALSRRGLLPRRHSGTPVSPSKWVGPLPISVAALLCQIRREVRRIEASGGTWRSVVDGLRQRVQDIWQAMPSADRARFLRHGRPWWDVHRHRIAGPVADRIDAALASGQLRVQAGHLDGYAPAGEGVEAAYRLRGTDRVKRLRVARVINCTGPGSNYTRIEDPLIRGLLMDGIVRPDPCHLGLDVGADCALVDCQDVASRRLFAVGPVTKGAFWEVTAVPDLRRQCADLAGRIAALVSADG